MDFVLQLCNVACEANESALELLLSHNCHGKAWQHVGSGMPDCCVCEHVFKEGGATQVAANAT
jgi:hypothetical protein